MSRSRLSLSLDAEHKLFIARYIGEIAGGDINEGMMEQLARLERPWELHGIIDMRRYDATVLSSEIEDLARRWNQLAQGRDAGCLTAIISEDPLVLARHHMTQSLFPQRTMAYFQTFDEGLDWIKSSQQEALAG